MIRIRRMVVPVELGYPDNDMRKKVRYVDRRYGDMEISRYVDMEISRHGDI